MGGKILVQPHLLLVGEDAGNCSIIGTNGLVLELAYSGGLNPSVLRACRFEACQGHNGVLFRFYETSGM